MKTLKITLFLFIISIAKVHSQTKPELIKELFVVMKQDSLMEQMGKTMMQGMIMQRQMFKKTKPDMINKSTENLDELMDMNQMVEKTVQMMKKFVKEDMVGIYDNHFTETEIKDFIQFYKTKSGQKFLTESPKLQNDIMVIMMQKYMPDMQKEFEVKVKK
jgi:uncharacterized protein